MAITLIPPEYRQRSEVFGLRRFVPIVLAVYLVVAVVLGSIFFLLYREKASAHEREQTFIAEIEGMRSVESASVLLKDRLSFLAEQKESPFVSSLREVVEIVENDPDLEVLDLNSDLQRVRITIEGRDSFVIERFLEEAEKEIKGLTFESLTKAQGEDYIINLFIQIPT